MTQYSFKEAVESLVREIPSGRVMTYGQIAGLCGNASASRVVGGIAHFGDPELPWHRVVSKSGMLASGYPGGREAHKKHLESEGVVVLPSRKVNIELIIWNP